MRHRADGDNLYWAVVTQAHTPQWSEELIQQKSAEIDAVASAYSMKAVHRLRLPTTLLDATPLARVIDPLRSCIDELRPEVVYLPHYGDVHSDHHAVFAASLSVLKAFYMKKHGVRRILSFETLSSTEAAPPLPYRAFVPNVYVDIGPYCDQKIRIMELFASEIHSDPAPRGPSSIRALARYRGATISVEYAEAFMLVREVL